MSAESDSRGVECPTCDRDDFESCRGMKVHHATIHGETLPPGTEAECSNCGSVVRRSPSRLEKMDHVFCSQECESGWRSENWTGGDHPTPTKGKTTVECAWCGDTKRVWPKRARKYEKHFCDRQCKGKWREKNISGEDSWMWAGDVLQAECECCGCEYRVPSRQRVKDQDHFFCSRECRAEWQSDAHSGEGNPNYRGGTPNTYGPNWRGQRRRAIVRDQARCQRCGVTEAEHQRKRGRGLDVHHITRIAEFIEDDGSLDWREANKLHNLVSLCIPCHNKAERADPPHPFGNQ